MGINKLVAFKPGQPQADLTRILTTDILDPMPLELVFEVPNAVVVDPERGWAASIHGFSQAPDMVGTGPGTAGRPQITATHLVTLVTPNPLYGQHPTLRGRYLRRTLALEIFEIAASSSQNSEAWYLGKPNLGRFNYANIKLIFFERAGRVYLAQNGNFKWEPGWIGQRREVDNDLVVLRANLSVPAWNQGAYQIEVDNSIYWSDIPRSSSGHVAHDDAGDWLPYDQDRYRMDAVHPYLPAADWRGWEPDASIMSNLPDDQRGVYLRLHNL